MRAAGNFKTNANASQMELKGKQKRICSRSLKGHYKSYHDIPEHILTLQCNIPSLQRARDNFSRILHLFTQKWRKKKLSASSFQAQPAENALNPIRSTHMQWAHPLPSPPLPLGSGNILPNSQFLSNIAAYVAGDVSLPRLMPTLPTLWHRSVDLQLAAELWHWP